MVTNDKAYTKEYFQKKNKSIECECGGKYKKYFKSAHEKTQKHISYEETEKEEKLSNLQQFYEYYDELTEKFLESIQDGPSLFHVSKDEYQEIIIKTQRDKIRLRKKIAELQREDF